MMLAMTLLSFLLFTTSFAAPQTDCVPPQALFLPRQTTITPPAETLQYVTLGVGFQNYTCSDQGIYTFIGDFAYLYDLSPLYTRSSPSFYNVQNLAFVDWLGGHAIDSQITQQIADSFGIEIVGVLNSQSTAGSLAPVWDLTQTYGSNAIAFGKVVGDLPSPYWDPGNVDWLHLTVTSGGLAQDILRVYTNGGEPLSHGCDTGSANISVPFTAQYWFYGGCTGTC